MFKSLKLYPGLSIDLEALTLTLSDYGYKRQESVAEEGDFARRGDIVDVFTFSFELPIRIDFENDKVTALKTFNPDNGSPLWAHNIAIILPIKKTVTKTVSFSEEFPLSSFVDLKTGDYVVHNQYGIGKFLGFQQMKTQGKPKDHLVIEYERGEKLFVPTESMHLVQKYIAFHIRKPKLYRLGSKEWQGIKERTRKGIQKLAWDLFFEAV